MEVIKEWFKGESCYNFYLKDGDKILKIIFGGNLDLYWSLCEIGNRDKNPSIEEIRKEMYGETKYTFTITKENYFIYCLFEELYDDIKKSRIFLPYPGINSKEDEEDFDYWKYLDEVELNKRNQKFKKQSAYQMLFDGNRMA